MTAGGRTTGLVAGLARSSAMAALALAVWNACETADLAAPERRVSHPALGTLVEIVVRESDATRARRASDAAFAEIERLEGILSEWRETSEISRLNRAPENRWVDLSPETAELLRRARAIAEATDGAFDPTVLPLLRLWGFVGGTQRVPTDSELARVRARVGWRRFEVDPERPRARLLAPGTEIGLGGIGKGFIADAALARLRKAGISAALVAAGGDLAFFGGSAERPWPIGLEDPGEAGRALGKLRLLEGGVSTSAPSYRYFEAKGRRFHHLLDPRTGRPARGLRSVTVVASSALLSDAFSTALFVMGQRARAHLETHPELQAVLLFEDGSRWVSPGLALGRPGRD